MLDSWRSRWGQRLACEKVEKNEEDDVDEGRERK